ncbi:hypothetical protein R4282_07190 [Rhodococcus oxybenzonivorans]|nr:hypothetical protein [Rhodococcus oxybenzonivorans]MDV7352797.1 hypothetical protein [Rhodococcus oxybenzonivorans]
MLERGVVVSYQAIGLVREVRAGLDVLVRSRRNAMGRHANRP